MNKEIVLSVPKEIDKSKADQILKAFDPAYLKVKEFEQAIAEVKAMELSPEKCAKAKRVRLDLRQVRTSADKVRKVLKEKSLQEGNAIQGVFNILKLAITENEESLEEIENHYKRIEEEKIAKIQRERVSQLSTYDVDGESMDLGNMADDIFNNLLEGSKAKWQAVKDAEEKAEKERIEQDRIYNLHHERKDSILKLWQFATDDETAENFGIWDTPKWEKYLITLDERKEAYDAEQDRIFDENERLKKEAEKAEKIRLAEEKKQAKIQAEKEAELEAERAEQQKKLDAEREAREKLEAEQAEKERLENERIAKEAELAKKKALAPDKDKLIELASTVISLNVNSDLAKETIKQAHDIIVSAINKM